MSDGHSLILAEEDEESHEEDFLSDASFDDDVADKDFVLSVSFM